jgi:nicotinate (nicotinamide) nucleotide adenylyltransferase
VSYSFDTLVQLRAQHPNADWYLVIGADQAQVFDTWYRWEAILEMATLAVAVREPQGKFDPLDLDPAAQITQETTPNDHCVEVQGYRWHNRALIERLQNSRERSHAEVAVTLNMPSMSVSASQIRNSIQEGVDVSHLLNPAVHAYILAHSLYIPKSITE